MRRGAILLAALTVWALAAAGAEAAEPIEGTWSYLGGQVLVEPDGAGFRGTVVEETRFGSCVHPVGDRMWSISGSGSSYSGTHQWYDANDCADPQQAGTASWSVTETGAVFLLDFCTAQPGQGAPTRGSPTTTCSTLERAKPPAPGTPSPADRSRRDGDLCSGPACLSVPRGARGAGCLRRGDFSYRFGVALRPRERRRLRVIGARFTLDWKPNGVDRRAPFVARVRGSKLAPGRHLLLADVRLRARRSGKSLHRRLQFRFDACK